jgi:hypothetical protein
MTQSSTVAETDWNIPCRGAMMYGAKGYYWMNLSFPDEGNQFHIQIKP